MQRLAVLAILTLFFINPAVSLRYSDVYDPNTDGVWYQGTSYGSHYAYAYYYNDDGLPQCQYRIEYLSSDGSWEYATSQQPSCSGIEHYEDIDFTVGSSGYCKTEGTNTCRIRVRQYTDDEYVRYLSIDYNKPSTRISSTYTGNNILKNDIVHTNGDITFDLTCSDGGSGCKENHYRVTDWNGNSIISHRVGDSQTLSCSNGAECKLRVFYHSKDNLGNENAEEIEEYVIDKKPPSTNPVITSLDMGTTSATVTAQTAADNVGVYYIFSGPNENKESNTNSIYFGGLQTNTLYCFYVQYSDKLHNKGAWSEGYCEYTDVSAPRVDFAPGSTSMNLKIHPNSPNYADYEIVYYEEDSPTPLGEIDWTAETTHVIEGLEPNKRYRFKVRAKGLNNEPSWWNEETIRTLANPATDLEIRTSVTLLEQGVVAATNPVGFIKESSPIHPCSYDPVTLYRNGTLSYNIGIYGSVEGIPVNFCESGSYDACADLGINDTCNQLIDEPIETPCVPYDAVVNTDRGYMLLRNNKYVISDIGLDPDKVNCDTTYIPLPTYTLCSGLSFDATYGTVTASLGAEIYFNGTKYTDCTSIVVNEFPIETPCLPTSPEATLDNIKIKFYRYIIRSPTNMESEHCFSQSVIYENETYTFEDGTVPNGWMSYVLNHPMQTAVEVAFAELYHCEGWVVSVSPNLTDNSHLYPILIDGWIVDNSGYNSSMSLKTFANEYMKISILDIPVVVNEQSKVQFMYKTWNVDEYDDHYSESLFKVSIDNIPPVTHGLLRYDPIEFLGVFEDDLLGSYAPPSEGKWTLFDSTNPNQYRPPSYIHDYWLNTSSYGVINPGYHTITLEFINRGGGRCNRDAVWIDNFRIVPV